MGDAIATYCQGEDRTQPIINNLEKSIRVDRLRLWREQYKQYKLDKTYQKTLKRIKNKSQNQSNAL
jgi:hypothetical protein